MIFCAAATCGSATAAPLFTIERFEIVGDNPLEAEETEFVLRPFTGPQDGLEGVEDAAAALENAIKKRGSYFHRVIVPPQRAAGGVFKLEVLTFGIVDISVEGNEHFDTDNILRSLPALALGQAPNSLEIARSLQLSNTHPARRVAVFMREADGGGLAAQVRVRDSRPLTVFGSINNTGDEQTGMSRVSLGAQHSNLFNRDHALTASYTTSPENLDGVQQYGAFYRAPLYQFNGEVSAYYTHSEIDNGRVADVFDVSGAGDFAGVSYRYVLQPRGNYNHSLSLAIDDRLFENDTTFSAQRIGVDVRSRPLTLGYSGRFESGQVRRSFQLSYVANTGGGNHNTDLAYELNRANAEERWFALRINAEADQPLPRDFRLHVRLSGQHSPDLLISGEQFGLGGTYSVRGFEEREMSGDSGLFASAEVYTPALPWGVQLLAFVDGGMLSFGDDDRTGLDSEALLSAGLGLRWYWRRYVGLSLDAAYVIEGNDLLLAEERTRADTVDFHGGLFVRF
ncbi:MAG: ShlB/FhaC/HecB family hemolysin secretion/activation protein [Gammaproteobacteria bacterium]